ncbi:MAG TPA: hypothetical protein PLA65_16900 [Spirochaetota bacterium]|nr:hypothetical protein [Spirochaetota bacterium]HOD13305.1 hypothetical protein [Spirochaetota bacterium]HPG49593.1 hypothetical protein [Spirochaetota bacterium]HPN13738.1 hypothetical protein [Spirochaetota bacterium]
MTTGRTIRRMVWAVIVALPLLSVAAEEKAPGPKDPVSPSADFRGKVESGGSWVRAALVTAQGGRIEGELLLPFATLELGVPADGTAKKRPVPLAEIASIEFTRWRGQRRQKNEYAFYPSLIRVTLADKTALETGAGIRVLHKLRLRTGERSRTLYSYFFDYREKDAWKNSGEKDMAYPEKNPHGETVIKIELVHSSETSPLDAIIKLLSK